MWYAVCVALICAAGLWGWRAWLSHLRWREGVVQRTSQQAAEAVAKLEERLTKLENESRIQQLGRVR